MNNFEVRFMNDGTIQIDNAHICFRNFAGEQTQYNRKGDRNFAVVIPDDETANRMIAEGWNVKVRPPREPDGENFRYMPVKVAFNDYGPKVYVESNGNITELNENTVEVLDQIEIANVFMDIRPYNWNVNGRSGRSSYLKAIKVVQVTDRFAARTGMPSNKDVLDAMNDVPF